MFKDFAKPCSSYRSEEKRRGGMTWQPYVHSAEAKAGVFFVPGISALRAL